MRESVGAAAILQILLIFIVIFISFLSVSVNFAQAFRIKNKIISYIEANEGWSEGSEADQDINDFLNRIGYAPDRITITEVSTARGVYYQVASTMRIDIPVLGPIIENFEITGETKIIFDRE